MFCGAIGHYVRDCPVASQYIQQGKLVRNQENKLTLPNGSYIPRNTPGHTMRDRVDNYLSSQGQREPPRNQDYAAANFVETPDEYVFEVDVSPDDPAEDPEEIADRLQVMEAEIESLREAQALAIQKGRREQFDGVHVPPKTGFPPRRDPPAPPQPNVHAQRATSKTVPSRDVPPHLVGKPGAPAGPPPRPQGPLKPTAMPPPKPHPEEPKNRYHAAIENTAKASDLLQRALDTQMTISTREFLATSVDARKQLKDLVTAKKVSSNLLEEEPVDSYLSSFGVPSSPPLSLDVYKFAATSPTAAASLPLRTITLKFGDRVEAECILDGGAQIIVMRKDIWEQLGTPITANKASAMESANAGTTYTLGLVENQLVTMGTFSFYLQIQIVEDAPFEVLLGRPFFDVLNCVEISRSGGSHQIEVRDPETGTPYKFATQPRQRKPSRKAAVNFRS